MELSLLIVTLILCQVYYIDGTELTFKLPDKDTQCFFEYIKKGVTTHVGFQVSLIV